MEGRDSNKYQAIKVGKIGSYMYLSSMAAAILPGIKHLPPELGATIVAIILRVIEAILLRKFNFDIFG